MRVAANGLSIEVDDQGPPNGEPVLLVMGLGMQLTDWPQALVRGLVSRGFRVLRMDNRDAGLSQGFDHLGVPSLATAGMRYALHLPIAAPYRIADMAADVVGVMDALGLPAVHLCGASMGGMIAQHVAATHPARVKSLALLMTTTGARNLPQPAWRVRRALMGRPRDGSAAEVARHLMHVLEVIGSPAHRPEPAELQARLEAAAKRAWRPAGTARQLVAVMADGDRSGLLPAVRAPTCVIHGEADPLVPVDAGRALVRGIAGAVGDFVPGMGHDLPEPLLDRLVRDVADNAARAVR